MHEADGMHSSSRSLWLIADILQENATAPLIDETDLTLLLADARPRTLHVHNTSAGWAAERDSTIVTAANRLTLELRRIDNPWCRHAFPLLARLQATIRHHDPVMAQEIVSTAIPAVL